MSEPSEFEDPRTRDEDSQQVGDRLGERPKVPRKNGIATAALWLGLLSFCTGVTGIAGIICGILGLMRAKDCGSGHGAALFGIVASILGIFVAPILAVVGTNYVVSKVHEAAGRRVAQNNLKLLSVAEHSHHQAQGYFTAPHTIPQDGKNTVDLNQRLSWRVDLLPYIEQGGLFRQFRRNQPWDSQANLPLSNAAVRPFQDFDATADPSTRYRVFYGNGAAFEEDRQLKIDQFRDGTSNTFLIVEAGDKVTWSRFQELPYEPAAPLPSLGRPDRDYFLVVLADGSVRTMNKTANPALVRAMITRAGGEVLTDFEK